MLVAIVSIDQIIELIKSSKSTEEARNSLKEIKWPAETVEKFIALIDDPSSKVENGKYQLSDTQVKSILELRLQRLTGMERDKLSEEAENLSKQIANYIDILSNEIRLKSVLIDELENTLKILDSPRKTEISDEIFEQDDEDLIQQEEMVVTVSHRGYIKRVALSDYRAQRRGGKGKTGMKTRDEDFVTRLFVANTHTPILFFTSLGMVYQLKCYKLPLTSLQSLGKAMINLLPISSDETIQTVMPMPLDSSTWSNLNIMFATAFGSIRRNLLSDFTNIMRNGKIAMKLNKDDKLI